MTTEQLRAICTQFTEAQDRHDLEAMSAAFESLYDHALRLEGTVFIFGSIAGSNFEPDPRVGIIRRLEAANEYEAAEIAELVSIVRSAKP